MSFLESLDRFSLTLQKVSAASSRLANPIGPFTTSLEQPFGAILRDAEPGEREMFRYVGPKTTHETTHAPPSSSSQPLFLVNPPVQSTPLRPTAASRAHKSQRSGEGASSREPDASTGGSHGVTDPEVLLGAALKLVDEYRPMPRKRALIVSRLDRFEALRERILSLEDMVESFHQTALKSEGSDSHVDGGFSLNDQEDDHEPTVKELTDLVEDDIKKFEKKLAELKRSRAAAAAAAEKFIPIVNSPPLGPLSSPPPRSFNSPLDSTQDDFLLTDTSFVLPSSPSPYSPMPLSTSSRPGPATHTSAPISLGASVRGSETPLSRLEKKVGTLRERNWGEEEEDEGGFPRVPSDEGRAAGRGLGDSMGGSATQQWETPVIKRFLSNSRGASDEIKAEEVGDEVDLRADEIEREKVLKMADLTVQQVKIPEVAQEEYPKVTSLPKEPIVEVLQVTVEPKPSEPAAASSSIPLTPDVEAILTKLSTLFPDIVLQSPSVPASILSTTSFSPADILAALEGLSTTLLPALPPSSGSSLPSVSSSSTLNPSTSRSKPAPTLQAILLSALFLRLLECEPPRQLAMSLVKSMLVERSKGPVEVGDGRLENEGEVKGGGLTMMTEGISEGEAAKVVYWGVGKRVLGMIRGGGEARVGFV